jgi:hypothetical protein
MPELLPLVSELRQRHSLVEEASELEEETKNKIRLALDRTPSASVMLDGKRKNIVYRIRQGARLLKPERIAPQYSELREKAIAAGLPGAELTLPLEACYEQGSPSRPLLTSGVLPKKPKKVQEQDGENEE